jgi:hypothetical protein
MSTSTIPTSRTDERLTVDERYLEKMAAEAYEQVAYERYKDEGSADAWLAHQAAVQVRGTAHARYLDALIAEQAALQP